MKDLAGVSKSEIPKTGIKSGDVKEVTEKAREMIARLPSDWKLDLYGEGLQSFQRRIFSQGNPLSWVAYRRAVDSDLVTTEIQNGIQKIIFPSDNAVDNKVEKVEVTIVDEMEVSKKLTGFEARVTELNESITELEGEKETLTEEVTRITALLSKAEAVGTEVQTDGDPAVVTKEEVLDSNAVFLNGIAGALKESFAS